jgi:hypothetical protein
MPHRDLEALIRVRFGGRIRLAGSWAISLQHNRICRLLGISPRKGKGDKEILGQIPIVEKHIQSKFKTATFEFKRSMLEQRGILRP